MPQTNNLALVVEQIILPQEQLNLQVILGKFQQLIPTNFVRLATKERNYQCSTEGWKEPMCERYIFFYHGQTIQLDIPHSLFNELEIERKENIPYPVYLAPQVLEKNLDHFAYTIENKNEIFIQKPLTIENLEKELNKWLEKIKDSEVKLSHYKLSLLSSLFRSGKKSQDLTNLKLERIRLKIDIITKEQELDNKDTQITQLTTEKDDLTNQISKLASEINALLLRPTQEQLNEKQTRITQLESNLRNVQTELVRVSEELNKWTSKFDHKNTDQVFQELENERREKNQRDQTISQLTIERNNLKTRDSYLYQQVTSLESELKNSISKITAMDENDGEINTLEKVEGKWGWRLPISNWSRGKSIRIEFKNSLITRRIRVHGKMEKERTRFSFS